MKVSASSTCLSICLESCTKVRKCAVMITRLEVQSFSKIWGEILTLFILLFLILLSYYQLNFRLSNYVFIFKKSFMFWDIYIFKMGLDWKHLWLLPWKQTHLKVGRKTFLLSYPIFNVDCPSVRFLNNVHIRFGITISAWSDFNKKKKSKEVLS